MKSVLDMAEEGGYAVPAFNIYNFGSLMGVKNAAKETGAPVILQMYTRLFDTGLAKYLMPALKEVANELKTPVAIHLDHGSGVPDDQIKAAVKAGVRKINYATDVCCAYIECCKQLDPYSEPFDMLLTHPENAVKEFAADRIRLLGGAR